MTKGSLVVRCQTQHDVAKGRLRQEVDEADGGNEPRPYRVTFTATAGHRTCPVKGCSGRVSTRKVLRVHF